MDIPWLCKHDTDRASVHRSSVEENAMDRSLSLRLLTLTMAMLVVVVSMRWSAPVAWAEPTATVYKDPT